MDDIETRLRQALRAEAVAVDPDEQAGLDRVRRRGHAARQRRRAALAGAALAAVVAVGIVVVPDLGDDGERVETPAAGGGTTVTAPPTTVEAVPPVTTGAERLDDSLFPRPGDPGDRPSDPLTAATGFMIEYFGETGAAPGVSRFSDFRAGEPGAGEIDVYRVGESGQVMDHVVSTLSLRQLDGEHWFVVAASSEDVVLETPEPLDTVTSPLAASGRGRGYEGTVVVDVRDRGAEGAPSLGQQAVIAGCCETLEPFSALVEFTPAGELGAVVVHSDSGIAAVDAFTVVPVRFGAGGETTSFQVFFHRGEGPVVAVNRTVPHTTGVLRAALTALLAGPSAEERASGLDSQFSSATASLLLDVRIEAGTAFVQFDERIVDVMPNASTSAASAALLAELDATVFQFPTIHTVRYQLGESCQAFGDWLQLDSCQRERG